MKQLPLDIGLARPPSLASFLAGPNEAAWKHLQLWAGNATRSPVPTYLWGPSVSGKTHLLQAVHGSLREQGAAVGWLDPSMTEPPPYDERWAVVVMDDVQAYSAVQQHAAFSWFVQSQALQRGVLAAGLLPPADLKLREDLRTRLGWGHIFELHVLSEPERRSVLRQAADARGVFLGDEVMDFILHRFSRDLGSLMQLLEHLDAYALQTQRAITIPLIKSMLENE
ncbi:MAG TPA: DnaA regulatory inactivator Hda [Ramlibacter sp.]|uniref:DnaA regulatory inactivator Hda n=1 Tax=Ramlibacter sp. TaxID=1917967 RepID=UPI002ED12C51